MRRFDERDSSMKELVKFEARGKYARIKHSWIIFSYPGNKINSLLNCVNGVCEFFMIESKFRDMDYRRFFREGFGISNWEKESTK